MNKITVYSKPNCMQCDFTKRFLDQHNLEYTAVDVMQDSEALARVQELGFQSLPVVVADGIEPFFGFRPDMLEKLA